MLLDQEHTRPIFRKLDRQLSKLASKPSTDNVHKFRTSSRRVEVLVTDLADKRTRNDKKLLKLLGRLRKKAGRLRDLDVEVTALRSLKIPQEPARKSQLMRTLAEERGKREKKLIKALDKKAIAETRKRLKRTASSLVIAKNTDPLAVASQRIADLELAPGAVTEEALHRFRIDGKRAPNQLLLRGVWIRRSRKRPVYLPRRIQRRIRHTSIIAALHSIAAPESFCHQ